MFEEVLNSVIESHGPLGLLVVMVAQTLFAPIPSEALLLFSAAIGISIVDIVIYGGTGLMIGSVLAFFIARYGGKPIIEKLLGEKWVGRLDGWIGENGAKAIFVTRLVPIVPFDLISYVSGITSLKFKEYFIATFLGAFPRCLILALIGTSAKGILSFLGIGLELTFAVGMGGLIVLVILERRGHLGFVEDVVVSKLIKRKSEEVKDEI